MLRKRLQLLAVVFLSISSNFIYFCKVTMHLTQNWAQFIILVQWRHNSSESAVFNVSPHLLGLMIKHFKEFLWFLTTISCIFDKICDVMKDSWAINALNVQTYELTVLVILWYQSLGPELYPGAQGPVTIYVTFLFMQNLEDHEQFLLIGHLNSKSFFMEILPHVVNFILPFRGFRPLLCFSHTTSSKTSCMFSWKERHSVCHCYLHALLNNYWFT